MATRLERATESHAVLDGVHAASVSTSGASTGVIDLAQFREVLFIVDTGTLGTSGTLDFKVQGAKTSGGTYADISGSAINQIVKASGDGKYALVSVYTESIQALGLGYGFIKGVVTPGTASATCAVVAIGLNGRHEPVSAQATSNLVQSVNV